MNERKPHVVVFYGGVAGNQDLSTESAVWFAEYAPRSKYQITPIEITPEGLWKVPLGSLPATGPIATMWGRLSEALRAVSPAQGLQRLLSRPVDLMLTFIRGKGGDDGSLHTLGQTLSIPVFGSSITASQQTSNKEVAAHIIGEMTPVPYSRHFRSQVATDDIIDEIRDQFLYPLFIKPTHQEGSLGVQQVHGPEELVTALGEARGANDILVQEHKGGQEFSLTLFENERGQLQTLPVTLIVPRKAPFYDHMAKRRAGRVLLHTDQTQDNIVIAEAEAIARGIWEELGCAGIACFDMVAGEDAVDVLEVNTVPTFTELTPTIQQLKAGGVHPTRMFDALIRRNLQ